MLAAFRKRIKQLPKVIAAVAESALYGDDKFKREGKLKIYNIVKLKDCSINKKRRHKYIGLRGIVVGAYITFNYIDTESYYRNPAYRILFSRRKPRY